MASRLPVFSSFMSERPGGGGIQHHPAAPAARSGGAIARFSRPTTRAEYGHHQRIYTAGPQYAPAATDESPPPPHNNPPRSACMSAQMSDSKGEQPAMLQVSQSAEEMKIDMNSAEAAAPPSENRDPRSMNDFVKMRFGDLFAEPDEEIYSIERVWSLSSKVFTLSKFWCYKITSILFALPLAVIWGIYFACLGFCMVWCCVPCLRSEEIECHCLRRAAYLFVNTCIAPCCEAFGKVFGSIRIALRKDEGPARAIKA